MKRVCDDHEPMIITRNGEPSVVKVSLDDFKALGQCQMAQLTRQIRLG